MTSFSKKDYIIAVIAGFLTGLFALPIVINLGVVFPFRIVLLLIGIPILWFFGMILGSILGKVFAIFFQFVKFVVTGFLNMALDFGILNILIVITGFNAGTVYSLFKSISFIAANINSYIWNKFWTFKTVIPAGRGEGGGEEGKTAAISKEYTKFLIVSLIGLGINVGAASLVVNGIGVQFGLSADLWANVGALIGSAAALFWNFIGYKLIVFKA